MSATPGQGGGWPPFAEVKGGTGRSVIGNIALKAAELPDAGRPAIAILAPASGSTGAKDGQPVIVVAQAFWKSKTIRTLRVIVLGAFSAFTVYVTGAIVSNGGFAMMDWSATLHAAINLGVVSVAAAVSAWLKSHDNNPVA